MPQEESGALPTEAAMPFLEVSPGCCAGILSGLLFMETCIFCFWGLGDQISLESLCEVHLSNYLNPPKQGGAQLLSTIWASLCCS